jgi:hypothetical protein
MTLPTYDQAAAFRTPIETELQRIAYRLHQGAISDESAASKLRALADRLDDPNRFEVGP